MSNLSEISKLEIKVPKVIHYCWFSDERLPPFLFECINTWKTVMPDYTLRVWDSSSFDFSSIAFVDEAYKARKWAFVADYIRLYALYTEGGIYLDSDVKIFKSFDEFLEYDFFTSHEIFPSKFTHIEQTKLDENFKPKNKEDYIHGFNVQAAIMGAKKGNPFLKDCLDYYSDKHLLDSNNNLLCNDFIIGPIISKIAEKYGYKYCDTEQHLTNNIIILKSDIFVGMSIYQTTNSYAIHLCNGTWREKVLLDRIYDYIRNYYPKMFPLFALYYKGIKKIERILNYKK